MCKLILITLLRSRQLKTVTYTKKDIIRRVAKLVKAPDLQTKSFVDKTFKTMADMLIEHHERVRIEIRNFGVLEVKPTKAKPKARNPRTNEIVYVPAHRKTHFKAGKVIREQLRKPLK
ncbi:MAG: HU family DNA-binding protein [Candidatus Neomarinimicrobiota bacterium]